ncbi:MAG: PLP-dependent aminotransferase family protein [Actinomycetota bacterium]
MGSPTDQIDLLRHRRTAARDGVDAGWIAKAFGSMIAQGVVEPGEKLAPVRTVAAELGVSTSTVAEAWSILRSHGLIVTDRRRGTTVQPPRVHGRSRYWRVPIEPGTLELDLSTGTPDPALLPAIEPILASISAEVEVTSYLEPAIVPELEVELRARWPSEPPALLVVDGANDALDRVVRSLVRLGDRVIVEDPSYPLLLDQLEAAGADVVGVSLDRDGPDLDALTAALGGEGGAGARALFLQTGANNPTGISLSPERAAAMVELLRPLDTVVVEDHYPGLTGPRAEVTLGTALPDRVIRVHSFSKTHGPDLRIAALGGPTDLLDEIERRRQLGPGWTSRLLQRVLLEMLRRPEVDEGVARAAEIHQVRRQGLSRALGDLGLDVIDGAGLNLWVPVANEHRATVSLAANRIGVAPGEPFRVDDRRHHIRDTSARIGGSIEGAAAATGTAATTPAA